MWKFRDLPYFNKFFRFSISSIFPAIGMPKSVHVWSQLHNELSTWFPYLHMIKQACGFLLLIYHYFTKQTDFRPQTSLICKNNDNKNFTQEKVARRCSTKKLSLKLNKISRKITVLEPLSNTAKGLQAIRLATLLKRNHRISVLEPAVRKCSLK